MDSSRFSLWYIAYGAFKVFLKQETIDRYLAKNMVKTAFPSVNHFENKFVNVKGNKSPFDGDIIVISNRNRTILGIK